MHRTRGPVRPHAARAHPDVDVVARTEAQERCCPVLEVRQDELAGGAVFQRDRGAGLRVDQLGVDEAARAQVHPVLLFALAPQRHADVADAHRLGDLRAPAVLELCAEGGLAASGLAGHEHSRDARLSELDTALRRPFDEVRGVRGREHHGVRPEELDREHQSLGVPGPYRNVREPDALERGERRPATNGPAL